MSIGRAYSRLIRSVLDEQDLLPGQLADETGVSKATLSRLLKYGVYPSQENREKINSYLHLYSPPQLLVELEDKSSWDIWWKHEVFPADKRLPSDQKLKINGRLFLRGDNPTMTIAAHVAKIRVIDISKVCDALGTGANTVVVSAPIGEGISTLLMQVALKLKQLNSKAGVFFVGSGRLPPYPPDIGNNKVFIIVDRPIGTLKIPSWLQDELESDSSHIKLIHGCRDTHINSTLQRMPQNYVHERLEPTSSDDVNEYINLILKFDAADKPEQNLKQLFWDELDQSKHYGLLPAMLAATRGEPLAQRYSRIVARVPDNSPELYALAATVFLAFIYDRLNSKLHPNIDVLREQIDFCLVNNGFSTINTHINIQELFNNFNGEISRIAYGQFEFRNPRIMHLIFRQVFGGVKAPHLPMPNFRISKWEQYNALARTSAFSGSKFFSLNRSVYLKNFVSTISYDRHRSISYESPEVIERSLRDALESQFSDEDNHSEKYAYLANGLAIIASLYRGNQEERHILQSESLSLVQCVFYETEDANTLVVATDAMERLPGSSRIKYADSEVGWFDLIDITRQTAKSEDLRSVSQRLTYIALRSPDVRDADNHQLFNISQYNTIIDCCLRAEFPDNSLYKRNRTMNICRLIGWASSQYFDLCGNPILVPIGSYSDKHIGSRRSVFRALWSELKNLLDRGLISPNSCPNTLTGPLEAASRRWLSSEKNADQPWNELPSDLSCNLSKALVEKDYYSVGMLYENISHF